MKKQIGVIFGSRSCEREVAIISAVQLMVLEMEVAMAMPIGLNSGGRIQMKKRFIARSSATPIVPTTIGVLVSLRA